MALVCNPTCSCQNLLLQRDSLLTVGPEIGDRQFVHFVEVVHFLGVSGKGGPLSVDCQGL